MGDTFVIAYTNLGGGVLNQNQYVYPFHPASLSHTTNPALRSITLRFPFIVRRIAVKVGNNGKDGITRWGLNINTTDITPTVDANPGVNNTELDSGAFVDTVYPVNSAIAVRRDTSASTNANSVDTHLFLATLIAV